MDVKRLGAERCECVMGAARGQRCEKLARFIEWRQT